LSGKIDSCCSQRTRRSTCRRRNPERRRPRSSCPGTVAYTATGSTGSARAVTASSARPSVWLSGCRPRRFVFSGWSPSGGPSEAEQMRTLWRGPEVELVIEPTARVTAEKRRADAAAARRTRYPACGRRLRAASPRPCALPLLSALRRRGDRDEVPNGADCAVTVRPSPGSWSVVGAASATARRSCGARSKPEAPMNDTVVFIPAWNEQENLAAVLDELRAELPEADVLVVDDGSTDATVAVAA